MQEADLRWAKYCTQYFSFGLGEIFPAAVSFDVGSVEPMPCLPEMAKKFGKKSTDWTKTESSKRFIKALSEVKNINSSDLLKVTHGIDSTYPIYSALMVILMGLPQ